MSKIKIEIKSWDTGSVLFEYEKEGNTIKKTLIEAVKNRANLMYADLSCTNLSCTNLRGTNLRGANLRGADLRGANLRGANLSGTNLSCTDLSGTDLSGTNLRGIDLSGTNLRGANLSGTDLSCTDLMYANLSGTDLSGTNLRGADLRGANLSGTDLSCTDLEPIKRDFFDVLLRAIPEIVNLKTAILTGKINGSTYEGECACLCGTLEKSKSEKIQKAIYDLRDSSRPIEIFFMAIKPGDTPENNFFAKKAVEWIEEFEGFIGHAGE